MKNRLCLLLTVFVLANCTPQKKANEQAQTTEKQVVEPFLYDLDQPSERFELPPQLEEVSGLSYYKPGQLLCIQDEIAVAYVYDVQKKKIVEEFSFGGYGDFEGIEAVGDEIYVLRSDGDLFSFTPPNKDIRHAKTDLPGKNDVEGLGYNPRTKRLLLAVKESSKKGEKVSDKIIYSFDLLNRAVWKELVIDPAVSPDFMPSGLAVHPITGRYYVISSAGDALIVMDPKGRIIEQKPLSKKSLRQPEGICFAPDGTMYISSEGKGKGGYFLQYNYPQNN